MESINDRISFFKREHESYVSMQMSSIFIFMLFKKKVASFEKVTIKGPQFFSHDSKEMIDFVFGNHWSE